MLRKFERELIEEDWTRMENGVEVKLCEAPDGSEETFVLWRTLEKWMSASGLGDRPRKLIKEMSRGQSMDVVLPTQAGDQLRLRVVSRPDESLAKLLDRLDLPLPNRPKTISNVVPKTASKNAQTQCYQAPHS